MVSNFLEYKGVYDYQNKHGRNRQGKIIGFVGILYHFTFFYVRLGPPSRAEVGHQIMSCFQTA
jgi:hypothetical protein